MIDNKEAQLSPTLAEASRG